MTILLTGAAGFLGIHMARLLINEGKQVVGIDNLNNYYDPSLKESRLATLADEKNFSFHQIDITHMNDLHELFAKIKPKQVIHFAAQAGVRYSITNPTVYTESNLVGFFNVLELCRQFQIEHLIHASSSSVYGLTDQVPFSTKNVTDSPVSYYAATKKSNEIMAASYSHLYGMPITCLRYFTVYGPWGRPDMSPWLFTQAILDAKPINVFNHGHMMRDYSYVTDVVQGTFLALNRTLSTPYKIYNIGHSHPTQLKDFIEILENSLGKVAIKNYVDMQPGDVYATYADISDTTHELGFTPSTSVEKGIDEWVKWYMDYTK